MLKPRGVMGELGDDVTAAGQCSSKVLGAHQSALAPSLALNKS